MRYNIFSHKGGNKFGKKEAEKIYDSIIKQVKNEKFNCIELAARNEGGTEINFRGIAYGNFVPEFELTMTRYIKDFRLSPKVLRDIKKFLTVRQEIHCF